MNHQPKKKRAEDVPLPPDTGLKPVQLQRRRVWRACESCRRKKVKCDGNEPTCTQCATTGSQCTWLQTKDRAALSRHYVQELEARLIHMESLFTQIAPVLEQMGQLPPGLSADGVVTTPLDPAVSVPPAIAQVLSSQSQALHLASGGDSSAPDPNTSIKVEENDDFAETFGQLALDERGHLRWMGGSSTMSLINSFRSLTTAPLHRVSPMDDDPFGPGPSANKLYFPSSVFFGKVRALPGPEEVEYPERDLADKLIHTYFSRLHFLMPVLDKPSFLAKYQTLMENTGNVAFHRAEAAFIALVNAVFACAARIVDDPRLATKPGENEEIGGMGMVYYERALILQYISHASIQVAHVQCFVVLASFLCSVNCLPQAWLLIGQAVRTGQDLGLHRSPRRLLISPIEKETRRKIWWSVYTFDRMLAVALGRPLGVDDQDCDVEPMVPVDDEDLPAYFEGAQVSRDRPPLMAGALAFTSLYRIAGRVLRQVYAIDVCRDNLEPEKRAELLRVVDVLDKELNKWCDDLPPVFKSSAINERDVSMGAVLCSHYYSILTTLHRNFLPVKRDQFVNPRSVTKAVSSARACIHLAPSIKNVVPSSHHLAFFIQNLFSSAVIILLYAMHSSNPKMASSAMDTARSSLVALEGWEGLWPGARKCRELLNDLTNTAVEAMKASAANGSGDSRSVGPSLMISQASPSPLSPAMQPPSSPRSPTERWGPNPLQRTAGSAVRNKSRRDRSHDPYSHGRQTSRSGPSFRDAMAQRARSGSRKRPQDDPDHLELAYPSVHPYPPASAISVSSHSSPASNRDVPSPRQAAMDTLPSASQTSPKLASPTFGMSPIHVPSPPRPFEYTFGMTHSQQSPSHALGQAAQSPITAIPPDAWNNVRGQATDPNGLLYFPGGSSQDTSANGFYYNASQSSAGAFDPNFYPYDQTGDGLNTVSVSGPGGPSSTTPPYANFSTPGLPFAGLDFIRNYNPEGFSAGGADDSLWQSIDPGAFHYEPDLPWTLSDLPVVDEEGQVRQD